MQIEDDGTEGVRQVRLVFNAGSKKCTEEDVENSSAEVLMTTRTNGA